MKPTLTVNDNAGPMESVTMSRHHYKAYEPSGTQRRYGELVPNIYIPPSGKFQSTTTTGETYQGRAGKITGAVIRSNGREETFQVHEFNHSILKFNRLILLVSMTIERTIGLIIRREV